MRLFQVNLAALLASLLAAVAALEWERATSGLVEPKATGLAGAELELPSGASNWRHHSRRQYLANYSAPDNASSAEGANSGQLAGSSGEPPNSNPKQSAFSPLGDSAKQQALALALDKEANKLANEELCRNFTYGVQHEHGGVITSPNYPNPYPTNLICFRLIEAPVGHYIVLEFRDQFHIEEAGNDCDNDKIEIRDGRYGYSKVLARYCGNKFPPEVRSTNEAMWLRFISDSSITHTGYKAVYRFVKKKNIKPNPPSDCRFNVTALSTNVPTGNNGTEVRTGIHSGVIKNSDVPDTLLNYSRDFNVSLECIWNITVMPGWKIYLTFAHYELNKPNDCDSNFIEIYEENLTEENQTVKFCGTRTEPQQSKSNVFNIRHHAIPTALGSHFDIIYTAFRDKGIEGCDAAREFDCDDGTCIHDSLKCDGQVNCKYRYDEASDPGPCLGVDPDGSFFETEHMVIILIVFLTLVTGMCASIVVSCWGKIQERRRRKQEYHMRKSREQSMEGQLNKVDQMIYGSNGNGNTQNGAGSNQQAKQQQRLVAQLSSDGQQTGNVSMDATSELYLPNAGAAYLPAQYPHAQPQLIATSNGAIYGVYAGANQLVHSSSASLDVGGRAKQEANAKQQVAMFGQRSKVHDYGQDSVNRSLQSVQQSLLASMANQQQQQNDLMMKEQQSVPDISVNNNQFKQLQHIASISNNNNHQIPGLAQQQSSAMSSHDTQNMLNFTLARNQQQQQQLTPQQQQKFVSSIYQTKQHAHDNNDNNISNNNSGNNNANESAPNNNNGQYGSYLRQHQQLSAAGINGIPSGQNTSLLNQSASAQTMPISLAKFNMMQAQLGARMTPAQQQEAGQQMGYEASGSQHQLAFNQQRALTLSTMHQPSFAAGSFRQQQQPLYQRQTIYSVNPLGQLSANQFSTSISCCNVPDDCSLETPLISDLVARSNELARRQQLLHQQQQQQPQGSRLYELRSRTMNPRQASAAIPRSISAHQLSKSQLRQTQQQLQLQQQQQQRQQQQQHQQHLHQQNQLAFKSISDVGHAKRYPQPPNHSLSYPHACTGIHEQRPGEESPALPPPPPPPNLGQVRPGQQPAPLDSRRAAFKVSRVDQQTGDTLQGADLISGNLTMGSLQFDEPSTESDATFGRLVSSTMGNTPLNHKLQQQQAPMFQSGLQQQQPIVLTHLADCNLIRQRAKQQANATGPLICNCGALERAKQLHSLQQHQHQQLQQVGSSHEFDDSDDAPCLLQPQSPKSNAPNFVGLDPSSMLLAGQTGILRGQVNLKQAPSRQLQQQHHSSLNNSLYSRQQQQYARFRQQSSELTADDDDEEEEEEEEGEEEMDGYELDQELEVDEDDEDVDDEEALESSGVGETLVLPAPPPPLAADPSAAGKVLEYRARSVVRSEELRDAPLRRHHLSGSHTSISCQSCTCGSQLQLDQAADYNSGNNNNNLDYEEEVDSSNSAAKSASTRQHHLSQLNANQSVVSNQSSLVLAPPPAAAAPTGLPAVLPSGQLEQHHVQSSRQSTTALNTTAATSTKTIRPQRSDTTESVNQTSELAAAGSSSKMLENCDSSPASNAATCSGQKS